MREQVSIEEAVALLLDSAAPPAQIELLPLFQLDRRVLAQDLRAVFPLPPFHRSAYDGYALRAEDTRGAAAHPVRFPVRETIMAGDVARVPLQSGEAARIMTGAALPEGADCVINFERVTELGDRIELQTSLAPWQNVDRAGDELPAGAMLFRAGERLTPAHIGLLAAQGQAEAPVYSLPHAALLTTGSELLSPGSAPESGKVYDSNLPLFRALLEREGISVVREARLPDDLNVIADAIRRLSVGCRLIVTTGGASVGARDLVREALLRAGAEMLFDQIRMKPGSCCCAGVLDGALIVGLSGNPGAAMTTYLRVVLPALRRICGRQDAGLRSCTLPLREAYQKTCRYPRILKGHISLGNGGASFETHKGQRNGMQWSLLRLNALAELPPSDSPLPVGALVTVFPMETSAYE